MTQKLQTTPKEIECNTGQLLDLLTIIFPQQNRQKINQHLYRNYRDRSKALDIKGMVIRYAGQPKGLSTQHHWTVNISGASEELKQKFAEFQKRSRSIIPTSAPQHNQGQNAALEWNGLFFRSRAEVQIAEALDRHNLLFFPNARCRITDRNERKDVVEVDFLVVGFGRMGLLEVDGATYHASAASDHQRDRLFMRQGILCSRFTAAECLNNPEQVVEEFLELLMGSFVSSRFNPS